MPSKKFIRSGGGSTPVVTELTPAQRAEQREMRSKQEELNNKIRREAALARVKYLQTLYENRVKQGPEVIARHKYSRAIDKTEKSKASDI